MNSRFVAGLLTMFLTLSAQAGGKRLLVVFKTQSDLQTAQASMQRVEFDRLHHVNQGASDSLRRAAIRGHLEKALKRINSLVVSGAAADEVARLRQNPNVALVEEEVFHPAPQPVWGYRLLNTSGTAPTALTRSVTVSQLDHSGTRTPWGISAVRAFEAWGVSHRGQGARVLILDTGVDRDHPSLAGNVEKGENFVGDERQNTYPFADSEGHGTHVAGTIAGLSNEAGFTGVAPEAHLLAGRVCSPQGCSNISIAQGVDWGIQEHVDVISMSLGGAWSTPAEREAINSALQAGITIVAASGNDGTARIGYPAALNGVIAVGAVDSKLQKAPFSQYGPELAVVAPGVDVMSSVPRGTGRETHVTMTFEGQTTSLVSTVLEGSAEVSTAIHNSLVDGGLGRPEDLTGDAVKGHFALIVRGGEIKFIDKVQAAIAAGAAGVVLYNNEAGLLHGALTQDGSRLPIPVFMVEKVAGERMKAALALHEDVEAELSVLTTDYATLDGTSMATPHVAGVAALIKATNKDLRPEQVKEILRQTATALGPNANNEYGSGLVNAEAATLLARVTAPLPAPVPAGIPVGAPVAAPAMPSLAHN